MENSELMQLLIHALLGMAIFSFLEFSIRTANAPDAVNRRAKIICAAGLMVAVAGMWLLVINPYAGAYWGLGLGLAIGGSLVSVVTMAWLEKQGVRAKQSKQSAKKTASP